MNTVTIPKKLANKDDLVVIPRKEYEAFSRWREMFKTFNPTAQDRAELKRARADYKAGHSITFHELKKRLADKG